MHVDELLRRLSGVQGRGPTWRAICPAHESKRKTRSLSVRDCGDGRILMHCFAGCGIDDIVGALGIGIEELFPPTDNGDQKKPRHDRPWRTRDVVDALHVELTVAWDLLVRVGRGVALSKNDRERALLCAERCAAMIDELLRSG